MLPYLTNNLGNPHSKSHKFGWDAEAACEQASFHIADVFGAQGKGIIFTSGATESNNLCLEWILIWVKVFWGAEQKEPLLNMKSTTLIAQVGTAYAIQMQGAHTFKGPA